MSEMNQCAASVPLAKIRQFSAIELRQQSWVVLSCVALAVGFSTASAADKLFSLGGNSIQLQDVSSEVGVYYQAMRLNRAADVWNAEVILTNRGTRALRSPLILSIESFTNTAGPLQTDGTDAGSPSKPFYDLSRQRPEGILAPGAETQPRTLTLGRGTGPPRLVTKVYALPPTQVMAVGVVRSLDAAGHPLADVEVLERGPRGERAFRTDAQIGTATLGQGDGTYTWKFSKPGYLPVWRQRTLAPNELGVLTSPRLTQRDSNPVTVTLLAGGQLKSVEQSIQISFDAGSIQQNSTATLTPLTSQTLPAVLPLGWSPIQAFWLELSATISRAGKAQLVPWGALGSREPVTLVRWNEVSLQWDVLELGAGTGTNVVEVALPNSGAYALLVADSGATAPPAPQAGQPLAGSSVTFSDYSTLSATGTVDPPVSPASRTAALVTAQAEVIFTNRAGALPSGLVLRSEVSETYELQDGTRRTPPRYENFVTAYQRPGDSSAATLHAHFPLRPLWLFGADELKEAIVRVNVLAPVPFLGGVFDSSGGLVALEGIRLLAGASDIVGTQAALIQPLNPTNFATLSVPPTNVAAAFELTVTGVAEGRRLAAQFTTPFVNSRFVLARVISDRSVYGLEPVERLASDASGNATSAEPVTGERLAGVTSAGQYVLIRVASEQGLLLGVARNGQGQPAPGVAVRAVGQPWLTISASDGRYRLVAPVGSARLSTTDLTTGDTSQLDVSVIDPARATAADVRSIPSGPRVVSMTPTNGAVAVSRVASIVLNLSEPLNAGTLNAATVQLVDAQNKTVTASVTLNARKTTITVLPADPLAARTQHTVRLGPGITDLSGLPLEGPTNFTFTTVTDYLDRPATAQVISHEPTNGIARMEGTPGIADPESPVILVNDTTGQTGTTLSKVDGSFTGEINASVEDRLRAVFVNQNGTRTEMPVGRQLFPDGSVALFSGGGSLTNANEELSIVLEVPPGATVGRTKFKIEPLKTTDLASVSHDTPPRDGTVFGLFNLKVEGDALLVPAKFTFRPDLSKLVPPPGKTIADITLLAATPRVIEELGPDGPTNIVAYQILGQLEPVVSTNQAAPASARPKNFAAIYSVLMDPSSASVALFGTVLYTKTAISGRVQSALLENNQVVPGTEIALGGAVVRARAGSENQRIFTLQIGEAVTVSDDSGHFSFLVPAQSAGGSALIASHPTFPRQFAASAGLTFDPSQALGGGVITFDRKRPPDTSPPSIVVTHAPTLPRVGETVIVRVEAIDESGPPILQLDIVDVDPPTAMALLTFDHPGFWRLECNAPAKVTLKARAEDSFRNTRELVYAILFGQTPSSPPTANDPSGPYVVFSQPEADAVQVSTYAPITLRFNEPVDPDILVHPAIYLTLSPSAGSPRAEFGRDQREVIIRFLTLLNGTDYTLTLQALRDLTGQILDQDRTNSPRAEPFVLRFHTAPEIHQPLPDIDDGKGVVMQGAYAYVIDRSQQLLKQFDLSIPSQPRLASQKFLIGPPWSLALVPDYSYARDYVGGIGNPRPPPNPFRSDLLVVAGKVIQPPSSYLRVYDLAQPLDRTTNFVSATLSLDNTALITRLAWSPPYLIAVENNLAAPAIHVLNLQTLLLSDYYRGLTRAQILTLSLTNTPGIDANSDGDFVDSGDSLPLLGQESLDFTPGEVDLISLAPNRPDPGPVGGFRYLASSSRFITAVVVDGLSGFVGALIAPGLETIVEASVPIITNRLSRPASFRSFIVGQASPDTTLPPAVPLKYVVEFPGWYPKQALLVKDGLRKLAVVSLISLDTATNSLRVIDVTRPDFLIEINEIPLPAAEFGLLQGATLDDQGTIILSTVSTNGEHFVLLDPKKLLLPAPALGAHPAILGLASSIGASGGISSFVSQRQGTAVASQRTNWVTQTAPFLRLVNVGTNWFDPYGPVSLADHLGELRALPDMTELLVARHPTNSNLIPPDPKFHWQLLLEAPGGAVVAGREISLAVMSVDAQGKVILRTNTIPPPSVLPAVPLRRLSDDLHSPAYNVYLSRPLVLMGENIDPNELVRVNNTLDRHVLFAGERLRVGISEGQSNNPVLGPFAGNGVVSASPTSNALPVKLGVGIALPVRGNVNPVLTAGDPVVLQTRVDAVNNTSCPGSAWIQYEHNFDCKISIFIDGQPLQGVQDESGNRFGFFTNVTSLAGPHRVLIGSAHVPLPGDHPFQVIGTEFDGQPPGVRLTASGTIQHEIEINHTYPIGHTIIQGVDIWDGHLSHSRQDVLIPGRRLSLDFSRSYSSQGNSSESPMGAGWTHSYNIRVIEQCGVLTVIGGEGSGNSFRTNAALVTRYAALAARYAQFLPPVSATGRYEFLEPQIGYHSTLARDTGRATNMWFFTKSAVRYHFVTAGKLSSPGATVYTLREIREPNGNAIELKYDVDGDPATLDTVTEIEAASVTNSATGIPKRGFLFEYQNVEGIPRIKSLRGLNQQGNSGSTLLGLEIRYRYDQWANLTNVVRVGTSSSDTRSESYSYTSTRGPLGHNLTAYTDPNGSATTYQYGTNGGLGYYQFGIPVNDIPDHEVVHSVTRSGAAGPGFAATQDSVTRFRYELPLFQRFVTDPRPTDNNGNPIPETQYNVNAYGATTNIVAPLGQITMMRWATDHRDGSVLDEAGQRVNDVLMTYKKDAEGQEQFFEYQDGRGNLTREIIRVSPSKEPIYDAFGNRVPEASSTNSFDALFNARTNRVDAEGNATISIIDPANGNLRFIIDAEGNMAEMRYKPNGELEQRIDPRGFVTKFLNYDIYGNARLVQAEVERGGRVIETSSDFDERSRVLASRDTFGHHARYAYDGLDRRIREEYLNDLSGLQTGPDAIASTLFLPGGEIAATTNALGLVTTHDYDALNRKVRTRQLNILQATGNPASYTNLMAYDEAGNVVTETDGRGVQRIHVYDALNRHQRTEMSGLFGGPFKPDRILSAVTYDRVNKVQTETDLHGFVTTHLHDGLYRIAETRLPFPNAIVRTRYDRMGTKRLSTDANGKTTTMTYDRVYRLKHQVDAENNDTEFLYDAAGNKTREENHSSGLIVEYQNIDGLNRPRSIRKTVPLGGPAMTSAIHVTQFDFNDSANTVTETNPRGFEKVTVKDGLNRIARITLNGDGGDAPQTTTFTYDGNGNQLTVKDTEGMGDDVASEYDGFNRTLRNTYLAGAGDIQPTVKEEFRYDENSNVTESTDKRRVKFTSAYDNLNRLLEKHVIESLNNGNNNLRLLRNGYDDLANRVTTTDANGNDAVIQNDELGRPRTVTDALGQQTTYEYDGVNKRAEIDRKRQRTEFDYDGINRLIETREKDAGGTIRTTAKVAYDDRALTQVETDRNGFKTINQVDALGRPVQTKRSEIGGPISPNPLATLYGNPVLVMATREYDGNNNNVLIVDGNNNRTAYGYDGLDRRIAMTNGFGSGVVATVTTYSYDKANNLLTEKDGRGTALFDWRYTYDARYRKISAENAENEITHYTYDENNNLISTTDPTGAPRITRYAYDELGKLVSVDESTRGGGRTLFLYDGNRNKTAQQDASGNLVTYRYDALNRLTNMSQHTVLGSLVFPMSRSANPGGGAPLVSSFGYDPNGNQTFIQDPRGQQVALGFDWLDRLTARSYTNHAEKVGPNPLRFQPLSFAYVYDGNGNLLNVKETKADGLGAVLTEQTIFVYDPLNRPATRTHTDYDGAVKSITNRYDIQGNRSMIVDPDGFETDYAYDARNRLINVVVEANTASPKRTVYTWWEDNLLKRVDFANGTFSDRSAATAYDRADRLKRVENHASSGALLSRYDYLYDANGNRTQQIETQTAFGAPETTTYTYDPLNRLASVVYGASGNLNYIYGLNGNRVSESGVDPVTALPVNRLFQYTATGPNTHSGVNSLTRIQDLNVPANTIDYEYDANLNQTGRIQNGVRRDFHFDIRDQIAATTEAGHTTTFDYNHDRLRVKKLDPVTGETRYLYDQSSVLVEYQGASAGHTSLHKYDYGYSLLSFTTTTPTRTRDYYLADGLRSTANLTDESGVLKQSYLYDAWGRVRATNGPSDNPRQYTGHYKDSETGLHYFGARYYDEEQGRFLSQDPSLGAEANPPSLSRFLYANANPLRYVDPTGYDAEKTEPRKETTFEREEREAREQREGPKQAKPRIGPSGRIVYYPSEPYYDSDESDHEKTAREQPSQTEQPKSPSVTFSDREGGAIVVNHSRGGKRPDRPHTIPTRTGKPFVIKEGRQLESAPVQDVLVPGAVGIEPRQAGEDFVQYHQKVRRQEEHNQANALRPAPINAIRKQEIFRRIIDVVSNDPEFVRRVKGIGDVFVTDDDFPEDEPLPSYSRGAERNDRYEHGAHYDSTHPKVNPYVCTGIHEQAYKVLIEAIRRGGLELPGVIGVETQERRDVPGRYSDFRKQYVPDHTVLKIIFGDEGGRKEEVILDFWYSLNVKKPRVTTMMDF